MRERTQTGTMWKTAAAFAILGCALPVAARLVAGPQGGDVHVQWRPSVDELTRERLAARYRLENPRKLEDPYTWRYDLTDPSRDIIRALVDDPAVEDTHEIDRGEYTLAPTAPRTARRGLSGWGDTLVGTADGLAVGLVVLAVFALTTRTTPAQSLVRGIPQLDAAAAGLFRIVFGVAAVAFFASHPTDASWLADTFDMEVGGRSATAVTEWLRVHPPVVNLLSPWLLLTGAAFTAGLFTRLTFALFVAGALVWAHVAMSISSTSIHVASSFMLALVALLPSAWGDAISVDAWRRRSRGGVSPAVPAGWHYGYSTWVPGLVLGMTWAAAAWAKLSTPSDWTDWVLNGTVKYHFVADSVHAPVQWGLGLAGHPLLAILASLGVIAVEGVLITAAFTRNQWYRLALGTAALVLFAGFYLFMGVFWPAWWILLLGFLPWRWLSRRMAVVTATDVSDAPVHGAEVHGRLAAVQLAIIAFVITQQLLASSLRIEQVPMFSAYEMYAHTYQNPEEWNASSGQPVYRLVLTTDRGRAELSACDPYPAFVAEFETAVKGSAQARNNVWRAVRACGTDLSNAHTVSLEGDVRIFDWNRLAFSVSRSAVTLGPLLAETEVPTTKGL